MIVRVQVSRVSLLIVASLSSSFVPLALNAVMDWPVGCRGNVQLLTFNNHKYNCVHHCQLWMECWCCCFRRGRPLQSRATLMKRKSRPRRKPKLEWLISQERYEKKKDKLNTSSPLTRGQSSGHAVVSNEVEGGEDGQLKKEPPACCRDTQAHYLSFKRKEKVQKRSSG